MRSETVGRRGRRSIVRIKTYTPIDTLTGGLKPGSLTLIHGSTGVGKTTLLLYMASRIAERGGDVIYVDVEGYEDYLSGKNIEVYHISSSSMEDVTKLLSEISMEVEASGRSPILILDSLTYNYSLELASLVGEDGIGDLESFVKTHVKPRLYHLEVQLRMLKEVAFRSGGASLTSAIFKPITSSNFRCDCELRLMQEFTDDRVIVAEWPLEVRLKALRCRLKLGDGPFGVLIVDDGKIFRVDEEVLRLEDARIIEDDWIGVIIG
jgi:energy-coupling factor transporter ATP-binding protein EcfA2